MYIMVNKTIDKNCGISTTPAPGGNCENAIPEYMEGQTNYGCNSFFGKYKDKAVKCRHNRLKNRCSNKSTYKKDVQYCSRSFDQKMDDYNSILNNSKTSSPSPLPLPSRKSSRNSSGVIDSPYESPKELGPLVRSPRHSGHNWRHLTYKGQGISKKSKKSKKLRKSKKAKKSKKRKTKKH